MSFRAGTFRKPYRDADRLSSLATNENDDGYAMYLVADRGVIRGYATSEAFSHRPDGWNAARDDDFNHYADIDFAFRSARIPELQRRAERGTSLFESRGGAN